jgi:hypothetical protein
VTCLHCSVTPYCTGGATSHLEALIELSQTETYLAVPTGIVSGPKFSWCRWDRFMIELSQLKAKVAAILDQWGSECIDRRILDLGVRAGLNAVE